MDTLASQPQVGIDTCVPLVMIMYAGSVHANMSRVYIFCSLTAFTSSGSLPIGMEEKSLPSTLPDTNDTDLPPPIPPKKFLEEDLFPPPSKLSESGEPHCNFSPLLLPKRSQEGAVLTPHPPNVHQQSEEL